MAYCVFNLDGWVLWFNRYGLHERTKKFVKIHGYFVHVVPLWSTNSSYYGFITTGEGINYYSMLKLEVCATECASDIYTYKITCISQLAVSLLFSL